MVTVVFTDLVGSTALAEGLDPETLRVALDRYFESASKEVGRNGGAIEKFIGDAVVAVFGLPTVHEDDAIRGIRAALAMQEALGRVNEGLQRDFGIRLQTRTGVNTGEVVTGDPAAGERLVTGDAVNIAARLEQAAAPDTILVGRTTYLLSRGVGVFEHVPPLALKGMAHPTPVYLLRSLDENLAAVGSATPFVDRDQELQTLLAALNRTAGVEQAQSTTIVGEPGIGKSRLAAEALKSSGSLAVQGRCLPYGDGITYWPIVQILQAISEVRDDDIEDDVIRKLRRTTPRPVDDLTVAPLVSLLTGSRIYPIEETARAFRNYMEAIVAAGATTLLIEDVHWAEPTLLELIDYLARSEIDLRVLCTARPELLDARPEWVRSSSIVMLGPLRPQDSAQLIIDLAGAGVRPSLHRQLLEVAGGNPFFAEQIVSMLEEQGALRAVDPRSSSEAPESIALPPSVNAVLDARLELLPSPVRKVAEQAAVVGKLFYHRAVVDLAGHGAEVDAHIAYLVAHGFVQPEATDLPGEEAYAFRHILIRDAVYRGSLKRDRARWHEQMGQWLQVRSESSAGNEEFVAYHFEQAFEFRTELGLKDQRTSGLAAQASQLLTFAGQRAADRNDAPAAAVLLRRALALAPTEHLRLGLLVDLSVAELDAGNTADAVSRASAAVSGAEQTGDAALGMRARATALMIDRVANAIDATAGKAQAEQLLEELLSIGDRRTEAEVTFTLGMMEFTLGNMSTSASRFEAAAALAVEVGDQPLADRALDWMVLPLAYGPIPVSTAIAAITRIVQTSRPRSRVEASARLSLSVLEAMALQMKEARADADLAREIYEELGMRLEVAASSQGLAAMELLAGEPARAEAELVADSVLLEELGGQAYLVTTQLRLAQVLDAQGRIAEASQIVERIRESVPADEVDAQSQMSSITVHALVAMGRDREAEELAKQAVEVVSTSDRYDTLPTALVDLGDVVGVLGHRREALQLFERARGLYMSKENEASVARLDEKISSVP